MELQDRFYTAPEVAQVLGVTLRSLYRYIRDGKIETFKTAGGRLRFTREAITNFMGPMVKKEPYHFVPAPRPSSREPQPRPRHLDEPSEETASRINFPKTAPVTPSNVAQVWPFRRAPVAASTVPVITDIYDASEEEEVVVSTPAPKPIAPVQKNKLLYRSNIRDLRLLAQKIQKSCTNAHVPYALTGFAGMSLQREMPPFSVIHVYVRFDDLPFFENVLQAVTANDEANANLCFLDVTDINLWREVESVKGFKVVAKNKLEADLRNI
ncbi:MAG: helix-turn-helix domain-containing protein [candidate division WWE3 bacterium]|nr:helix-turn-helix domain-containing protein [candidate division WWE3 bacterium]